MLLITTPTLVKAWAGGGGAEKMHKGDTDHERRAARSGTR